MPDPDEPSPDHAEHREHLSHELAEYAELEVSELAELAETGYEPPARVRRWWILPLRLAISLALLGLLFTRLPSFSWSDVVPEWRPGSFLWLAVAVGLTLGGVALSALRWHTVLLAFGHRQPFSRLLSCYFAGQFVSNVLPTTIGGDVLRVSRLSRETGDAADTFASVVIERLTGWLVLPVLTFAGMALDAQARGLDHATNVAILIAVGTLVALAVILLLAGSTRAAGRFQDREGWQRFIAAVHVGVVRLRRPPRGAALVIGAGFLYQFVLVLAAYAAAEVIGIQVTLTALLAFYPAVLMAQVLPIGISGIGLREGAFVLFLTPLGVPSGQAVALGLLLYLLNVGASLAGAPAFAVGGRANESLV